MMRQGLYPSVLVLLLSACTQSTQGLSDDGAVAANATTSTSVASASSSPSRSSTAVIAGFSAVESNALVYLVDTTLNQVLTNTQYQSAGFAPTSDVNVTGSCAQYFANGGSTHAAGVFNLGTGSAKGSFDLALDFNRCAAVGSDGNTYIITGSDVALKGTELTTTDDATGIVTDAYQITDIHGTIIITDATGYAVPCPIQLTDTLTYSWGDSVTVASSYSGTVCQLPQSGGITRSLPVTLP